MEEKVKKKNNAIIIVILLILLLASIGFICYDKLLKKEEPKPSDCNCPECEKCSKNEEQEEFKLCTLDMKGKSNLDVLNDCIKMTDENSSNVEVKNIEVNGKVYNLKYVFEGAKEQDDEGSSYYRNSVTKIYVNGKLIDAFPGQYRNILFSLEIKDGKLVVQDGYPSETPPGEHIYNIIDVDSYEYFWLN